MYSDQIRKRALIQVDALFGRDKISGISVKISLTDCVGFDTMNFGNREKLVVCKLLWLSR